jgi:hypothetical protein
MPDQTEIELLTARVARLQANLAKAQAALVEAQQRAAMIAAKDAN